MAFDPTNAVDLVSVIKTALKPPEQRAEEVANASQILLDLRLPETVQAILAGPLTEIGFGLRNSMAQNKYGSTRQLTLAERESVCRFLLHVPRPILENYFPAHHDALAAVAFALPPSRVCVLSEGCQAMDANLAQLIETGWREQGVTAVFVPWQSLTTLQAANADKRREITTTWLQLQNGAGPVAPATTMDPSASPGVGTAEPPADTPTFFGPDLQAIINILAEQEDFTSANQRRNLIDLAGLADVCASVDWEGPPNTVAGAVILSCKKYGPLREPPKTHPLGLLIAILVEKPGLPPRHQDKLKMITTKYKLLPS